MGGGAWTGEAGLLDMDASPAHPLEWDPWAKGLPVIGQWHLRDDWGLGRAPKVRQHGHTQHTLRIRTSRRLAQTSLAFYGLCPIHSPGRQQRLGAARAPKALHMRILSGRGQSYPRMLHANIE